MSTKKYRKGFKKRTDYFQRTIDRNKLRKVDAIKAFIDNMIFSNTQVFPIEIVDHTSCSDECRKSHGQ